MDSVSKSIRSSGWKQGSLIGLSDVVSLINAAVDRIPTSVGDKDEIGLIVISQDCDLVQELVKEPYVELIVCKKATKPKPQYLYGRNPRILEIGISESDDEMSIHQVSVHDRFRVEKSLFKHRAPDTTRSLQDKQRKILCGWIGKRYTRPAFPDAFNQRLIPVEKNLEKLLKSDSSHHVTGIFINGADQEHSDNNPYSILVQVTYEERWSEDYKVLDSVENFVEELWKILNGCSGIEIYRDEIMKVSEADLTLGDLRHFERLDKDYRSLPEEEGKAIPVEAQTI